MWRAEPGGWGSWAYEVRDDEGRLMGDVGLAFWRERGTIRCAAGEFAVWRQSGWGAFVLEQAGAAVASAQKQGFFSRSFAIQSSAGPLTLRPRGIWRRTMVLYRGHVEVGSIAPAGVWSRTARVDLPEDLAVALRLFLVWLTLLLWRRAASSTAGSGGS